MSYILKHCVPLAMLWRLHMLKTLRTRLAKICMLITATILATMSLISLGILEEQFNAQQYTLIENHLNSIVFRLQTEKSISHTFLSKLEATNQLLINIEDNGIPLLFKGNTPSITPRAQLFSEAIAIAEDTYHFSSSTLYASTLDIPKVSFEFQTPHHEHYLAIMGTFSSDSGHFRLILLKNMKSMNHYIGLLRWLFVGLTIIGFLLLGIFSFWFSGHATRPIELAQKKQTDFIAAASHELRSPLAVIHTNTSALALNANQETLRFTTSIHNECTRMKHLIDDLLLLANMDAKHWSIQTTPTEIDTLVLDMYECLIPLSKQKNLIFNVILPDDLLPPLMLDNERIRQTLSILLDNAFTYTPAGNKVSLVLTSSPHVLTISVIDNGPGITEEHKPYIFDRFYRVDSSRHDKNHYGLGLSIAYEMMQLHHGHLTLQDTPGGGCTFSLIFPIK